MAKKPVLEGGKRDEITAIALKLFMQHGYEQTSVRMILNEVGGEVGMFYHYFKSKAELFEAAVKLYLKGYTQQFGSIVQDSSMTSIQQLKQLMALLCKGTDDYSSLVGNAHMHWSVRAALHQSALKVLEPYVQQLIEKAIEEGTAVNIMKTDTQYLTACILYGVAGVLHTVPATSGTEEQLAKARNTAICFISFTLGISPDSLGGVL